LAEEVFKFEHDLISETLVKVNGKDHTRGQAAWSRLPNAGTHDRKKASRLTKEADSSAEASTET